MTDFDKVGCVLIKSFLDPQATDTVSRYMEYALISGAIGKPRDPLAHTYAKYADPLIETILYNSRNHVEEVTGKKLYPTYSYSRIYLKGDNLGPHTDRPSCEVSVTCNVATKGAFWPIWMRVFDGEPMSFTLEPGDAVVYKGCEVEHWREKATDTEVTAQFMLHYVDQDGPYAGFKFDKRTSLGVPFRG